MTLRQVHERHFFASSLYRNSDWCSWLLGVSGRPRALSPHPSSARSSASEFLLGRDEETKWLRDVSGDCLVAGGPGVGKTALLQYSIVPDGALFVVDHDREAIANAVRDLSPSAVIVDDAHVDPNRLSALVQLRRGVGAEFRIIATSWSANAGAVTSALRLARSNVLELSLIDADTMVEIIKGAGLHGPAGLVQLVRRQAEGRAGLAVTLTRLCLEGDVREVVSGESLLKQLEPSLDIMLDVSSTRLLAPFALGGAAGTKPQVAAEFLGLSRLETSKKLARLGEAGVVRESRGEAISVHPDALRWIVVRNAFFRGPGALRCESLLDVVEDLEEAVSTVPGAVAQGASVPNVHLRVERVGTSRVQAEFASLGATEARMAMSRTGPSPDAARRHPANQHRPGCRRAASDQRVTNTELPSCVTIVRIANRVAFSGSWCACSGAEDLVMFISLRSMPDEVRDATAASMPLVGDQTEE